MFYLFFVFVVFFVFVLCVIFVFFFFGLERFQDLGPVPFFVVLTFVFSCCGYVFVVQEFAWKCRASWPCAPPCVKSFDGCPHKWAHQGQGLCTAPPEYAGICRFCVMLLIALSLCLVLLSPAVDFSKLSKRGSSWSDGLCVPACNA